MLQILNISCGNKYKIVVMLLILMNSKFTTWQRVERELLRRNHFFFLFSFVLMKIWSSSLSERPLYTAGRGRFWCDTMICFDLTAYKSQMFVRMQFVRLILCKTETVRFKELRNIFINELKWRYFDIAICIPNVGIYLLNFTKTLWFHESKMYFFMNCLDN